MKPYGFSPNMAWPGRCANWAKQLGVTHPLLYRYFPTKAALIERVYEQVYLNRWSSDWEALLHDRSRTLSERLTDFYMQYSAAIDRDEWIRIFVFSGLHHVDICTRYLDLVGHQILAPVAEALAAQAPHRSEARNLEIAWGLHGQIVYIAIRRWIYGLAPCRNHRAVIADAVAGVIGAGTTLMDANKAS